MSEFASLETRPAEAESCLQDKTKNEEHPPCARMYSRGLCDRSWRLCIYYVLHSVDEWDLNRKRTRVLFCCYAAKRVHMPIVHNKYLIHWILDITRLFGSVFTLVQIQTFPVYNDKN